MTGKEILEEEFEKAGMRGYKADQVDAFLQSVATYVDDQNTKNNDLTYKIQILADKIEEYKKDEENIRDALLGAQKLGSSILNEAKSKAETISREARISSDQLLSQAKMKIESLTRDSLQKVNYEITVLKKECEREQKKLDTMKLEVSNFRSSILRQYKTHLDLLSNLPSVDSDNDNIEFNSQPIKTQTQQDVDIIPDDKELVQSNSNQNSTLNDEKNEELGITDSQTIKSNILSLDNEDGQEEKDHTKEFNKQNTGNIFTQDMVDNNKANNSKDFKTYGQRTNFAEKYGELNFGKNKDK